MDETSDMDEASLWATMFADVSGSSLDAHLNQKDLVRCIGRARVHFPDLYRKLQRDISLGNGEALANTESEVRLALGGFVDALFSAHAGRPVCASAFTDFIARRRNGGLGPSHEELEATIKASDGADDNEGRFQVDPLSVSLPRAPPGEDGVEQEHPDSPEVSLKSMEKLIAYSDFRLSSETSIDEPKVASQSTDAALGSDHPKEPLSPLTPMNSAAIADNLLRASGNFLGVKSGYSYVASGTALPGHSKGCMCCQVRRYTEDSGQLLITPAGLAKSGRSLGGRIRTAGDRRRDTAAWVLEAMPLPIRASSAPVVVNGRSSVKNAPIGRLYLAATSSNVGGSGDSVSTNSSSLSLNKQQVGGEATLVARTGLFSGFETKSSTVSSVSAVRDAGNLRAGSVNGYKEAMQPVRASSRPASRRLRHRQRSHSSILAANSSGSVTSDSWQRSGSPRSDNDASSVSAWGGGNSVGGGMLFKTQSKSFVDGREDYSAQDLRIKMKKKIESPYRPWEPFTALPKKSGTVAALLNNQSGQVPISGGEPMVSFLSSKALVAGGFATLPLEVKRSPRSVGAQIP